MPFRYAVAKVSLDHHSSSCWKTMARHVSAWDLRHLSGKYPWLRVDNETIEEFRAPFEWVEAASESASSEEELETDDERGKDGVPKRQHSHSGRYSLANPTNRRAASVIKAKPSRKGQFSPKKLSEKSGNSVQTPPIAPQKHSGTSHTTDAMIPPPKSVLEASVYSDWAALRQHQHETRRNPKKPTHSIHSLSLPSLHRNPQVASKTSLASQLTRLAQQERSLQQQVYSQIEAEKAKLPLTFLFERHLDQSYCRQKSVETITTIFAKLQFRLVYSAFQRWKALNDALNKQELQEAALERAKIRALALLDRLASDCYVGTLDRAFGRWRNTIKAMAEHERQSAARKIQCIFRQRRAKALFHELKRASMDRAYKRDVEIQQLLRFERYARAVRGRAIRLGVSLLLQNHAAKRIQGLFRWIRTQKRILRRYRCKIAAVRIQTRWRIRIATRELNKRRRAAEIRRERERVASINLQRRTRGYLARQHAALRQAQLAMESQYATKFQQFWRRYQAREALKKRFLVRKALLEAEQVRLRELERLEAIRQDALRKECMVVHIQRVVRGFLGRCEAKRRQHMQKRDLAARRVQTQWRRRQGNYALHLRFLAQRERLDERRNAAALQIQCAIRVHMACQYRRELLVERQHRRHSVTVIQRVVRGRHARKEYIRARRATVTIQSAMRERLARDERHQRHKERLEEQAAKDGAALRLQCWLRTLHARRMAQRHGDERQRMEELVQQSALLIQKRARGMEARRVTTLLARAMRLVEQQQRRRYAYSTQRNVNTSPLLAFLSSDYHQTQPDLLEQMIQDADAELISEDRAVVLLQRHFRGYATRLGFVVLQTQQRERKKLEERMCHLLQRVARGYLARKRVRQLKQKQRSEALMAAYVRERHSKSQQEAWEERYKQEQMTLQLQRLQLLETMRVDAKRDAEVAKWQAEAALYRKQELQAQLEAQKLQDTLKHDAWELVTDAKGQPYYYNTISGESSWERPSSPPKPLSKEEKTDEKPTEDGVLSAKPDESKETATDPVVPEGFCSKCRNTEAVKACLGCQPPINHFCSECFTLHHGLLDPRGGTTHDFQVLRPFQLPSRCQASKDDGLCHALASYYCQSCVSHDSAHRSGFYCEDCFTAAHDSALLSSHLNLAMHFRLGAALCAECQQVLALRQCVGCDEALCAQCFETIHEASQKKQSHEFTQLELMKEELTSARDAYCIDCTLRKCTRLCNLCGDGFCSGCFDKQHSIGQRALHTWIPWTQFTQYDDWLVIHDDQTGKDVYFNIETKESTHTKPFVLQSGEDRHPALFHEREQQLKARALALEGEVTQLQDKLRIVEEEKAVLIQRPRSRVANASNAEAKPDQGKPRKGKLKSLFSRSKGKKATMAEGESTTTPEELAKQALKKGVTSSEQSLLQQKLMTRSRGEKEAKAQRTIGTKHFEDAMIQQLSTDPPSKANTMEMESVEDEVKAVNAETAFDGEEDAATFLDEVIASSVEEAEMARVQRRLMPTLAQHVTKQLFEVVSACLPAYSGATHTPKMPSTAPQEEPAPGGIDVTCRHTIRTRMPPLVTSPVAPFARTASFKTKSKRIVGLGTLAARSFLQGMRSPATASPSRPSSRASSTRKLPIGDSPGGEVKDSGPMPGVPFSTANTPRPSPRKAIAVLKTCVDEEKDPVDEAIYPIMENIAEEYTGEEETIESLAEQAKKRMLRRSVRAKPKPTSPESSSSAYTLILPMKSPLFDEEDALARVPIEFQLPPPSLPAITSPPRYTATRHNAMPTTPSSSELSVTHSEKELVELDPLGSLGLELHETLDLAPGVKLQSPDGGITKVGPELPVVPSKMRRATFLDTSASRALETLKPSSRASQPVISPVRPTASAPPTSMSRFFLTEYDDDDTCSSSNLSTTVSSNVASVKNLFRKPSKVVRPCTASAACTNGSRHSHACQAATQAKPDDTFAELIKQRAFQRKPSILTASPPKKAIRQPQSRRPTEHTPAGSPLARRSLQPQPPNQHRSGWT